MHFKAYALLDGSSDYELGPSDNYLEANIQPVPVARLYCQMLDSLAYPMGWCIGLTVVFRRLFKSGVWNDVDSCVQFCF